MFSVGCTLLWATVKTASCPAWFLSPFPTFVGGTCWVEDVTNNTSWHGISHPGSTDPVVLVSKSLHCFFPSHLLLTPLHCPHLSPLYSLSFSCPSFILLFCLFRLYYRNFGCVVAFGHLWFPDKNILAGKKLFLSESEKVKVFSSLGFSSASIFFLFSGHGSPGSGVPVGSRCDLWVFSC